MRFLRDPAQRRYYVPVVLCLALTALLLLLPTGYEGAIQYQEADRCAARVLAVDDSTIVDTGLVRSGAAGQPVSGTGRHRHQHAQRPLFYLKGVCLSRFTASDRCGR